jgi:CHAD domain-containing protein
MAHATTQVIAALSRSLRRNANVLSSSVPRVRKGEARAIHRLRVATRRLRESLPAAARTAGVDAEDADNLVRDLRRVTRGLGPVRELDVAMTVLADFADREQWPSAVVEHVEDYCRRLRDRAFGDAAAAVDELDARQTRARLRDIADTLDRRAKSGTAMGHVSLSARLREGARALTREIEGAGTLYSPTALHQVRIAAKKLRYVLELSGDAFPGSIRRLKSLQTALGHLHDAQVLQHRIQELASTSGDRGEVATLTSMDRAIEAVCREWHAKVLKAFPAASELARKIVREVPATIRPGHLARPVRMRQAASVSRKKRTA